MGDSECFGADDSYKASFPFSFSLFFLLLLFLFFFMFVKMLMLKLMQTLQVLGVPRSGVDTLVSPRDCAFVAPFP